MRVEMDKVGQRFSDHYREMRGLQAPVRHRFNQPFLPQNLKDTFPGLELTTTLYEEGHRIDFLQFERLPNAAVCLKVTEWTLAIDRYVYQRYQSRCGIEGCPSFATFMVKTRPYDLFRISPV
ncbi:MAG: hypothetical protein AAFP77_20795 [Bacteroidota bacterium]